MILDKNASDAEKAKRLVEELDRLAAERKPFEADWLEAQLLVSSVTLSFDVAEGDSVTGFAKPKRITDKPANYHETLVSGIIGYACNPNMVWMKLGLSDEEVMQSYGVKDWIEQVEKAEYEEFDNSNLYTEMKIVIDQVTTYGLGVMHIDVDKPNSQVRYKQINLPEVFVDTNEHNEYETVFRRFFMTTENAVSHWGKEQMHQNIRDMWGNENNAYRAREIEILHAVFRRKDRNGASQRNTDMPFASFFVDVANRHIIEESGYESFPYAIFVWERVGGKKYPISPAIKATNDVKLLHRSEDTRLTLAQMSARQPIAVPESMRGANEIFGRDGYISPGAIVYYKKDEHVPSGIGIGANYPITLEVTNRQADNIKDWFFVDFFLMLQQQNIARMTATAVQALQGEKAAVMTHMIVNLKKALQVVVQRTYDIMAQQGRLPELPPALLRPHGEAGHKMRFNFASVLSQVQQALLRFQGTRQFLPVAGEVAQLGRMYPEALDALDRYDFDVLLQNEARAAHVPETAIREDEDVEAIRERRAQAAMARQQEAQMQQAQETLAKNYNKLNEPPKPGSPAEALFGQGEP
jgi:hypothetical protein